MLQLTMCVAMLVSATVGASIAFADSVILAAARDNTLFEDPAGSVSNGSGPVLFAGVNNLSNVRRALVFFDVRVVPAGAVVDSVELELHVSNVSDPEVRVMSLHRVLADWGEGTSSATGGNGAPSAADDATWIHSFFPDDLWVTPGGDFASEVSAMTEVGGTGSYGWSSAEMSADVIGWLETPVSNFGWLVMGDETTDGTARRFDSRENPVEAHRPLLTLHFTIPEPVEAVSWGRVKAQWEESSGAVSGDFGRTRKTLSQRRSASGTSAGRSGR